MENTSRTIPSLKDVADSTIAAIVGGIIDAAQSGELTALLIAAVPDEPRPLSNEVMFTSVVNGMALHEAAKALREAGKPDDAERVYRLAQRFLCFVVADFDRCNLLEAKLSGASAH